MASLGCRPGWTRRSRIKLEGAAFDTLRSRFAASEESIQQSLNARSRNRLEYLGNTLETRKKKE
ncbi:hypothetical protein, partial [Pseudomonas sp. SST3]|uniref:hypothetical protein n=1 Tax=Pseudomonas sp. SST3 TaxID=2267882 RepID=UPI001F50F918